MLNKVILIGRLTKDPVMRYTSDMVPVTTFTLAVNRNYVSQSGERPTDFIPIVAWRKLAEICANNLKKGRLVAVTGSIQTRTWDDSSGNRHWVTEVVADDVRFLEPKSGFGSSSAPEEEKELDEDFDKLFEDIPDDFDGFTPIESEDDLPF
ncbi:single-stranded DNA-binding protein [Caldanaerobacter subterraneus KAk]|uniref:single-stranded DNA-binding protein n=1 Tax=Caldanaerobacter subterraneus TaxID=911092 RepID=UPI0032BFFEFA